MNENVVSQRSYKRKHPNLLKHAQTFHFQYMCMKLTDFKELNRHSWNRLSAVCCCLSVNSTRAGWSVHTGKGHA